MRKTGKSMSVSSRLEDKGSWNFAMRQRHIKDKLFNTYGINLFGMSANSTITYKFT